MAQYQLGTDTNAIALSVQPSTVGVANTRANFRITGQQVKVLAQSGPKAAGVLNNVQLGAASTLRGGQLVIVTIVVFGAVKKGDASSAATTTVVNYTLSGGQGGEFQFKCDEGDIFQPNPKTMVITKVVDLI